MPGSLPPGADRVKVPLLENAPYRMPRVQAHKPLEMLDEVVHRNKCFDARERPFYLCDDCLREAEAKGVFAKAPL